MLTTGTCAFAGKSILDFFKFCGYLRPRGGVPVAEATTKLVTFLTNQSLPQLLDRDRIAEPLDLGIMDVAHTELGRMGGEDGASLRRKIVEAVCGPDTGLLRASARAASRLGNVGPRTRTQSDSSARAGLLDHLWAGALIYLYLVQSSTRCSREP